MSGSPSSHVRQASSARAARQVEEIDPPRAFGQSQRGRRWEGSTLSDDRPQGSQTGEYYFNTADGGVEGAACVQGYDDGYRLNMWKQGDSRWLQYQPRTGPENRTYVPESALGDWREYFRKGWAAASRRAERSGYPVMRMT